MFTATQINSKIKLHIAHINAFIQDNREDLLWGCQLISSYNNRHLVPTEPLKDNQCWLIIYKLLLYFSFYYCLVCVNIIN